MYFLISWATESLIFGSPQTLNGVYVLYDIELANCFVSLSNIININCISSESSDYFIL